MNRIVLIGNGFDLAHGLPTSYVDFINWYWDKRFQDFFENFSYISQDCLCTFDLLDKDCSCWNVFAKHCHSVLNKPTGQKIIGEIIQDHKHFKVTFSPFFERICKSVETKGWVDIEQVYYEILTECIDTSNHSGYHAGQLNNEIDYIRKLLTEYLLSLETDTLTSHPSFSQLITSPLKNDDICIAGQEKYHEYFSTFFDNEGDYRTLLASYGYEHLQMARLVNNLMRTKTLLGDNPDIAYKELNNIIFPERILLLNFNYTFTGDKYADLRNIEVIHIHGDLNKPEGMIFGYGDELDEEYNRLLKQTDNKYLDNIKSIKYLEANNYRNTLRFVESSPLQVFVMGHSCGNSDRTLLNTLFEHRNCVSIKPFFYQKDNGEDNYMEIAQNICRNFTDMKLFRDRVVCKTNCTPLPQCP